MDNGLEVNASSQPKDCSKKIRILIEYDGEGFRGWQTQPGGRTIQSEIETVVERVVGERAVVFGSSRTDAGVSAKGQVAHFVVQSQWAAHNWRNILNHYLPDTIRILEAEVVPFEFHSQRNVYSKVYEYRILNRTFDSALDRRVYFFPGSLDWKAMEEAAQAFVGEHDFRAFCAAKSAAKTSVRRIYRFDLIREGEDYYRFEIEGSGFLKQQVRTMVGTLVELGERKRAKSDLKAILASRDRRRAGRTAPAKGLCLVKIQYCH